MARIALAQINATVGDISGNTARISGYIKRAQKSGADLVVFPEMALTGYPPEDLLFKTSFIDANLKGLAEIAKKTVGITAILGFIDRKGPKNDLYNAAAIIVRGKVQAIYHKHLLPNYSVFDEERYFKAGRENKVFSLGNFRFGVSICEDIWHPVGPTFQQVAAGSQCLINISASPYQRGKAEHKERMLSGRAADYEVFLVYVNLVGGQDELVFDGQSVVFDPEGKVLARAKSFAEDLLIVDIEPERACRGAIHGARGADKSAPYDSGVTKTYVIPVRCKRESKPPVIKPRIEQRLPDEAEVYQALITGTRDYVEKNGFKKVIIGLSGGIDSALTAAIAVDGLGNDRVVGLFMPSRFSAKMSRIDAQKLANNLGIEFHVISIKEVFNAYLKTFKNSFTGVKPDITEENIQARIRGNILMAFSNKFGYLVLTTGNKSEIATGYCTLYGDMAGGFAALKDIPKTLVYRLAAYRNQLKSVIPERSIKRPPSAELRSNQKDIDTLPDYAVMDPILAAYVEENLSPVEIAGSGFAKETVRRVVGMVDRNEYKRRQAPPGVKITSRAFGKDWRLPLTNAFKNNL
ncbi:MAG: NAD+ synthase [Candidatus Omnitrophica bacterium]|nr:NAD+ synthase [Candidatus Omnitrophota bacterium]